MENESVILLSVPSTQTITNSNTHVLINKEYNRRKHNDYDKQIDANWNKRVSDNPKIFNGTKFRLSSVSLSNDTFTMNLGLTCYKEFLGTNWCKNAKFLAEDGVRDFQDSQAYMSDPLGVGTIVLTTDDKVIFLTRSEHCAEAPGLWDVPGGHPEPQEIVGKIPLEEIKFSDLNEEKVVSEIYDSIMREVVDEVNIPASSLSRPNFIGVAQNISAAKRPSSEFIISCSLSSSEVRDLYTKGNQEEAYESTNIQFVPKKTVLSLTPSHEIWANLAPSAKGCIMLYKLYSNTAVLK
ncbi:uridine diphosphate glucose pyrophosphatase NUDT22-like [Saccostrea echinata]|uniref:uridine diphosphate glucose pyrophosphatase NUDT22-like n=1 Tax=Saccostrea echinata TaxID=191078 RepID=UPI002A7F2A3C|nr:uridine diphosphate glucose pyrophosphatase NUDT22-like [Saccostrea echinata]